MPSEKERNALFTLFVISQITLMFDKREKASQILEIYDCDSDIQQERIEEVVDMCEKEISKKLRESSEKSYKRAEIIKNFGKAARRNSVRLVGKDGTIPPLMQLTANMMKHAQKHRQLEDAAFKTLCSLNEIRKFYGLKPSEFEHYGLHPVFGEEQETRYITPQNGPQDIDAHYPADLAC